jgi:hypothetical protein
MSIKRAPFVHRGLAVVYLVTKWSVKIRTEEARKVDWVDFDTFKRGALPDYNAALERHLHALSLAFES